MNLRTLRVRLIWCIHKYQEWRELQLLVGDEIHIWSVRVPVGAELCLPPSYAETLSDEERSAQKQFAFAPQRNRFLMTRAMTRHIIGRYSEIHPRELTFGKNRFGRPTIENPTAIARRLRFNISHTDTVIVVALTLDREVGIDTEAASRVPPSGIADNCLSGSELTALQSLPPGSDRRRRFWQLWTLKESYAKARGKGLSLSLPSIIFTVTASGIRFDAAPDSSPDQWQFWQFVGPDGHIISACAERDCPRPPGVRTFVSCPFEGDRSSPMIVALTSASEP